MPTHIAFEGTIDYHFLVNGKLGAHLALSHIWHCAWHCAMLYYAQKTMVADDDGINGTRLSLVLGFGLTFQIFIHD